jgi:hypothetical protein
MKLPVAARGSPSAAGGWSETGLTLAAIGAVAVLGIASFAWIYGAKLTYYGGGPIRSDGTDYYLYLPALFLDHDLTLARTVDREFGGDIANAGGLRIVGPHHEIIDEVGIGEAVMIAPFFAGGQLLAVVSGSSRNGFSWPYQAAAAAAGFVYALLGLVLTGSILRRWFGPGTVVISLLAITFGTDLFHYATYDAVFSHAFSFFLVAAAFRLSISLWERPGLAASVGLAATLALVALVRPTNLVVVALCGLVGVMRPGDLPGRIAAFARRFDLVLIGTGVFLILCVPQLVYWHAITGKLLFYAYKPYEHLAPLHPHLLGVLFSVRKGLFFWTPLLLLAVAGIPFLRRAAPPLFLAATVYLILQVWVVSSWSVWWYGGSFGMRPFVEAMPVFALGLAALVDAARGSIARRTLAAAIVLTTLLCLHAMIAYWLKTISYDGTTFHDYLDSFRYH